MTESTVVLTAQSVTRLLPYADCIDAIAAVMRAHEQGRTSGPASSGFPLPNGSVHAKLAGIQDDRRAFVVAKVNVNLPGNPARHHRPTIQGALILFDAETGQPLAIMDSIALTAIRTAAVAALAARHLTVSNAHTITIVGCGEQGEAQLRAMQIVRPIRTAFAVDIDSDRALAFAERLSRELQIPVQPTGDLDSAIHASDICVTCTTSKQPLVYPRHLHRGLFVAAVGADNPEKQEIDSAALAQARVVVDSLSACAAGGDLHHAIRAGHMTEGDVHGELSAIVAGRLAGRSHPDETFVFDSTGTALQDVAAAVLVHERARTSNAGLHVRLDDRDDRSTG